MIYQALWSASDPGQVADIAFQAIHLQAEERVVEKRTGLASDQKRTESHSITGGIRRNGQGIVGLVPAFLTFVFDRRADFAGGVPELGGVGFLDTG